jgi:hypothetical protein
VNDDGSILIISVKLHGDKDTLRYVFFGARNDGLIWLGLIKYHGQRKREADEFKKN